MKVNRDGEDADDLDSSGQAAFLQTAQKKGYLTSVQITGLHNSLPAGFTWNNIKMFTVLTGLNGVGKSQLILAILQGFENLLLRQHFPIEIAFTNIEIPHVCALYSENKAIRNNLLEDSEKKYDETLNNISQDFAKYILDKLKPQQYMMLFPQHEVLYQEFHVSDLFPVPGQNNYQFELESKFKKFLQSKLGLHANIVGDLTKLTASLLVDFNFTIHDINLYLEKYHFKYRLDPRTIEKAGPTPRMSFTNPVPNQPQIDFGWLSPGETLKLHTILWIMYTEKVHKQHKPTLLLLDEPDAHLEPSLSKEYFDVLMNFVIGRLGFQVIMTTHRPTSLCLLPLEVINTLERRDDGILLVRPNKTRREAIETLTSGFVNINEKFRIVFVEADDDARFYTAIQDQLIRTNLLPKLYQVVYKSFGKERPDGKDDNSSCDIVQRLVNSMTLSNHDSSLIDFIFGIIDNDSKDEQRNPDENSPNLLIPKRYAIENYLLDPINLFYYLKKIRCSAPKFVEIVAKIGVVPETISDLLLDILTREQLLQRIIDAISFVIKEKIDSIFTVYEQSLSESDKNLKVRLTTLVQKERFLELNRDNLFVSDKIEYVGNIFLNIPAIWTKLRGKNLKHLLVCALEIEKGPKLQMSTLISSLTQNEGKILIPMDLFEIIQQLHENISQKALEKLHEPIDRAKHEKMKSTVSGLQAQNKALIAKQAKKDAASEKSEKSTTPYKASNEPQENFNNTSWFSFFRHHAPGFVAGIVISAAGAYIYKSLSDGGEVSKP